MSHVPTVLKSDRSVFDKMLPVDDNGAVPKPFKKLRFFRLFCCQLILKSIGNVPLTFHCTIARDTNLTVIFARGSARLCRCAGSPEHQFAARLWDKCQNLK